MFVEDVNEYFERSQRGLFAVAAPLLPKEARRLVAGMRDAGAEYLLAGDWINRLEDFRSGLIGRALSVAAVKSELEKELQRPAWKEVLADAHAAAVAQLAA